MPEILVLGLASGHPLEGKITLASNEPYDPTTGTGRGGPVFPPSLPEDPIRLGDWVAQLEQDKEEVLRETREWIEKFEQEDGPWGS